jgi:hypothetical protein
MANIQITAEILREAFRQTQREILAKQVDHQARWERFAELLNAKLTEQASATNSEARS